MPLDALYFGKDDAESDVSAGGLLRLGFLRTHAYSEARAGRKGLVIGRKGSGKSAICLMLKACGEDEYASLVTPDEISSDEMRLFELPGIGREQAKKLIWRYAFTVQIAKYILAIAKRRQRKGADPPPEVAEIRRFLADNNEQVELSLHEKFWRIVEKVRGSLKLTAFEVSKFGVTLKTESAATTVSAPSPGVRASSELDLVEQRLVEAMNALHIKKEERLLLLVDQIEKVWSNDRNSDAMVVGLLLAVQDVNRVFEHVNCVVFLRTDIYELLQFQDRDKFRGMEMQIDWSPKLLLELFLSRARASIGTGVDDAVLWTEIFPVDVDHQPTRYYLVARTLMRPRDIIQLGNACADTARKNRHESIERGDIEEALGQYSNWKLSDLINEYRINYPFLNDVLVLFSNSSFVVSRALLDRKLQTIQSALASRYPEHEPTFTIHGILPILYSIGFLGVMRGLKATFVYEDPNRIENEERQFVIHPCFRSALRARSAIGVRPFERSQRLRLVEEISLGFSARQASVMGSHGGRRSFYYSRQIVEISDRIEESLANANIPDDVATELRANLENARQDGLRLEEMRDEREAAIVIASVRRFLTDVRQQLIENGMFDDVGNKQLVYALDSGSRDLDSGDYYRETFGPT